MNIKLDSVFFLVFFILIGIVVTIITIWIIITEKRLKRFLLGKKAKDLEDTILGLEKNITELNKTKEFMQKDIVLINEKLRKSIRGLETIRFNPFPDQGRDQSFPIAMLDEEGNGVIIYNL